MIFVSVTEFHLTRARDLFDFQKLKNSITDGEGNLAGALGEIIVCEYYNFEQTNTFDYDLKINSTRIDVKTKRFTPRYTPDKSWNINVSDFNTRQDCDHYCFVGIADDYSCAYIYGFIAKKEFFKIAVFGKKNDIDPNGNGSWKFKSDCYNILISQLNELSPECNYLLNI